MRHAWIGLLVLVVGCAEESKPRPGDGAADGVKALEARAEGSVPDTAAGCTAEGNPAACDPIDLVGCASGACYVLKDKNTACVCTPGTAAVGDNCNTTTECAPGAVCAGTAAPGTCRALCETASPACPSTDKCTGFPPYENGFGYCEPK